MPSPGERPRTPEEPPHAPNVPPSAPNLPTPPAPVSPAEAVTHPEHYNTHDTSFAPPSDIYMGRRPRPTITGVSQNTGESTSHAQGADMYTPKKIELPSVPKSQQTDPRPYELPREFSRFSKKTEGLESTASGMEPKAPSYEGLKTLGELLLNSEQAATSRIFRLDVAQGDSVGVGEAGKTTAHVAGEEFYESVNQAVPGDDPSDAIPEGQVGITEDVDPETGQAGITIDAAPAPEGQAPEDKSQRPWWRRLGQ